VTFITNNKSAIQSHNIDTSWGEVLRARSHWLPSLRLIESVTCRASRLKRSKVCAGGVHDLSA